MTFTASISTDSDTLTGSVTIFDGSTTLGNVPLKNGIATFSTDSLSTGAHTIVAIYSGDDGYNSSTIQYTHTVSSEQEMDMKVALRGLRELNHKDLLAAELHKRRLSGNMLREQYFIKNFAKPRIIGEVLFPI